LPKTHGTRFQAISLYLLIRSQSTYAVWAGFEVIKVKIEAVEIQISETLGEGLELTHPNGCAVYVRVNPPPQRRKNSSRPLRITAGSK
jgi:hypothetical protein